MLVVWLPAGAASAQDRAGLIGGVSLGGGGVIVGGTTADPAAAIVSENAGEGIGAAIDVRLGGMVNPRWALMFELARAESGTAASDGDVRVGTRRVTALGASRQSSLVFAGAGQYWLMSNAWVRGGIGAGVLERDWNVEEAGLSVSVVKETGMALLAAAGVELWRRGNFAFDVEFHVTSTFLEGLRINAPAVQVGLTWY